MKSHTFYYTPNFYETTPHSSKAVMWLICRLVVRIPRGPMLQPNPYPPNVEMARLYLVEFSMNWQTSELALWNQTRYDAHIVSVGFPIYGWVEFYLSFLASLSGFNWLYLTLNWSYSF
jgi:hypothetical protein